MKYEDDGGGHRCGYRCGYDHRGGRLPGYLAALEPGWGCPWLGRWLFELLLFAVRPPGRLCPPNGRVACPVLSPVSVLLECDQTPLSDLLSLIPAVPTTQREANHVKASHYVTLDHCVRFA